MKKLFRCIQFLIAVTIIGMTALANANQTIEEDFQEDYANLIDVSPKKVKAGDIVNFTLTFKGKLTKLELLQNVRFELLAPDESDSGRTLNKTIRNFSKRDLIGLDKILIKKVRIPKDAAGGNWTVGIEGLAKGWKKATKNVDGDEIAEVIGKYAVFYENAYDRKHSIVIESSSFSDSKPPVISDFQYKLKNQILQISVKATDDKSKVKDVSIGYMIYKAGSNNGSGGFLELDEKEDGLWEQTLVLSKGDKIVFGGSISVSDSVKNNGIIDVTEYTLIIP